MTNRLRRCAKKTIRPVAGAVLLCCAWVLMGTVAPAGAQTVAEPPSAVNLLKTLNLRHDVVRGKWIFRGKVLVCRAGMLATVIFPYHPPAEYDFRITFARLSGNDSISMFCTAAGYEFDWDMGGWGNKIDGFEEINGHDANANATTRHFRSCLQNRRKYTCLVKVRKNGVRAYLNGRLISQRKTDYHDMSVRGGWHLPGNELLGLAAQISGTVFYSATLTPVESNNNQANPVPFVPMVSGDTQLGPLLPASINNPKEYVGTGAGQMGKFTSRLAIMAQQKYRHAQHSALKSFETSCARERTACRAALNAVLVRVTASGVKAETRRLAAVIAAMNKRSYDPPIRSPLAASAAQRAWQTYVRAMAEDRGNYLMALGECRLHYAAALQMALADAINSNHLAEALRIDHVLRSLQRQDVRSLKSY